MKILTASLLLALSTLAYSQPAGTTYLDTIASLNDDYQVIEVIALYDNTTLISSVHKRLNYTTKNVDVYLNGNLIYQSVNGIPLDSNQFDTTLVVDSGDTYKVRCWNVGEAIAEISLTADLGTSIETLKKEEIKIYPIPVSSILYLELKEGNSYRVELMNLQGQIVREMQGAESVEWDVRDLKNGMYIIKICIGGDCIQERIIKVE